MIGIGILFRSRDDVHMDTNQQRDSMATLTCAFQEASYRLANHPILRTIALRCYDLLVGIVVVAFGTSDVDVHNKIEISKFSQGILHENFVNTIQDN